MSGFDKFAWLKAVYRELAFTDGHKAVLAYIAVFTVLYGRDSFQVRQSTIAQQCGISRQTVNKAISNAKDCGYLVVSRRRATGYGRNGADELRLSLPAVSQEGLHHSDETAESCKANGPSDVKQMAESCKAANSSTCENGTPISSGNKFWRQGARASAPPPSPPEEPPPKTCTDHPNWNGAPCHKCRSDKDAFNAWLTGSRKLLAELDYQRDRATGTEAAAISDQRMRRIAVLQRIAVAWK